MYSNDLFNKNMITCVINSYHHYLFLSRTIIHLNLNQTKNSYNCLTVDLLFITVMRYTYLYVVHESYQFLNRYHDGENFLLETASRFTFFNFAMR